MKKQVLINVEDKDIRVAVLESGELTQLFVEQIEEKSIVGNIYKGLVESIVPGLNAAFVDIGLDRNAFLHFADICSDYGVPEKGAPRRSGKESSSPEKADASDSPDKSDASDGSAGSGTRSRKAAGSRRRLLKVGDEILVQATKEPMSTKGARVTSYISLPGRYLVLLPISSREGGVSRRIEDANERKRLRTILKQLKADEGSFIVRTAGLDQDEDEISSDVKKLTKLWTRIRRSAALKKAPSLVHDDHEILGRLVRDELAEDTDELIIDSKAHARQLKQILASILPQLKNAVTIYDNPDENLFEKHQIESQFQKALKRRVWLKSGGSIVIDEAEALIAIDVNTGKFVGRGDQEETILKTNLEAAETVSRQLRLRDVGGIIVIDFIDMKSRENQRELLRCFKELLKRDRAKTTVIPLTEYGLLQMTRKRVRQSLSKVIFRQCPYCDGSGRVLTEQQIWKSIKYEILRTLKKRPEAKSLRIMVHPDMRRYLETEVLDAAKQIANRSGAALAFVDNKDLHVEECSIITQ
ncbi:Rne/Rng family ribonuclease [Candidatus Sumerlaeota bacterium]|nr:Rne/Rng family ribonuclease [Candidatus Sumerlaeota bacterium]